MAVLNLAAVITSTKNLVSLNAEGKGRTKLEFNGEAEFYSIGILQLIKWI